MKFIKVIYNHVFNIDYIMRDASHAMKLRHKILKSKRKIGGGKNTL